MNKRRLYFYGYEENEENRDYSWSMEKNLLFISDKSTSLYEALNEFQQFKKNNNKNYTLTKIIEGPAPEFSWK